jgi:hypothetical protein
MGYDAGAACWLNHRSLTATIVSVNLTWNMTGDCSDATRAG